MTERTCTIDGCPLTHRARGMCSRHYQRWQKYGDPHQTAIIVGDEVARFWSYVDKRDPDECWPWKGSTNTGGYAQFRPERQPKVGAHRYSFTLHGGTIPEGYEIDHLCRTRRCVNPAHLDAVTPAQNLHRAETHFSNVNAAKTHCKRGHEFTPENTYRSRTGRRHCRACARGRRQSETGIRTVGEAAPLAS